MRKQIAKKDRPALMAKALPLLIEGKESQIAIAARLGIGRRTLSRWRLGPLREPIEKEQWARHEVWLKQFQAEQEADAAKRQAEHKALLESIRNGPPFWRVSRKRRKAGTGASSQKFTA